MDLRFSRCCSFVSFGNKVDIVVHYGNNRSGFLLTPVTKLEWNELLKLVICHIMQHHFSDISDSSYCLSNDTTTDDFESVIMLDSFTSHLFRTVS